ncbi:MAG: TAXI family TRAP transporter solute-binding subunit [Prochloraceae cyanobacterium]|nr:TAXI family TRAP transporter solute-binding subunit [Prochloraceae cyanobacterium]
MPQEDSWLNKFGLTIVFISVIMVGFFGIEWFRESQEVKILTIATAGKNGTYYNFARILSQVVQKHNPHLQIKVLETEGSRQNEEWLGEKKVDFALLQSDTPVHSEIKAVSFLFPEMFHLVVNSESGISSVSEIKGKRIALMPKRSGSYALFWSMSEHYGLTEKDVSFVSLPFEKASAALVERKVDALFFIGVLGGKQVTQLLQHDGIGLVKIEQGDALRLYLPAVEDNMIPKGTYSGAIPIPKQNLQTVAVRAVLVTHQDLDSEIIYEITRIIYEARNDLVEKFPQAGLISRPEEVRQLGFSFHEGAQTYYDKDKPPFLVEYAEPMGLLLSVSVLCLSGIWQLRTWLQIKQKNRADSYNLEIIKLIKQIHELENLEQLAAVRQQLFDIFEKVIIDLDKDRISPESFQSFTFPWEIALTILRHRENLLINDRQIIDSTKQ